jgi:general secretion pathway protein I
MTKSSAAGFTLVEVLVALGIVAIALVAGMQASAALTNNAERQADRVLAQLCAQNALAQIRLARQLPDVGESAASCPQAGRTLELHVRVQPTPNPNFRRVDAQVAHDGQHLLLLSTVVGRY